MLSSGDGLIVGNGSDLQLVALDDLIISRRDDWKKKLHVRKIRPLL